MLAPLFLLCVPLQIICIDLAHEVETVTVKSKDK